jgi:TonB family protein
VRNGRIAMASVCLLAAFTVLTCQGQQPATGGLPKNDLVVPNVGGVFIAPVTNASFSGTVEIFSEQKLPGGSVNLLKTINYIARDSQGRTYNENRRLVATDFEDVPPLQTFHIWDPVKGLETHLNPYTFVARQMALMSAPPRRDTVPVSSTATTTPSVKSEDLGTQTFENLVLKGVRQSQGAETTDEFWYSPDLSIYIIRKHEDPKWKLSVTVTQIDRREPDASRFVVPNGYRVVDGSPQTQTTQIPGQPGVHIPDGKVSAPQLIHSVEPQYSDAARQAKLSGICLIGLIVDANGLPQDVHVVRSLGHGLDEKAVEAVNQYRFKPAMYQGHPVAVQVSVQVSFKLF